LLLVGLGAGAYLAHQLVLEQLGRRLSRAAGVPIRVEGLRGKLSPAAIVLEGLTIDAKSRGAVLVVDRAEAELELSLRHRPVVQRIRLMRPRLHLTPSRWVSVARDRRRPAVQRVKPPQRRAADLPLVEIRDGSLTIELDRAVVRSGGIYLHRSATPDHLRLVLGSTQLLWAGNPLLAVSSAAADLDPHQLLRPARVAALAASVHLPGSPDSAIGLHKVLLERQLDGYQIQLEGKTAGRRTGKFQLTCQLDGGSAPQKVDLSLHDVALSALEPLLEAAGLQAGQSRVSGTVTLQSDDGDYRLHALLSARGLRIEHPYLASRTVGPFDAQLRGDISIAPDRSAIRVNQLRFAIGDAVVDLDGELVSSARSTRLSVDLTLPKTPCQKVLASLPAGFAPALDGMALDGELGVKGRLRLDTADLGATVVDLTLDPLRCRMLSDPPEADVRSLLGEVTVPVSGPRGRGMQWPLGPSNPDWQPYGAISRHVRTAFVVAEDGRFFGHDGFDEKQLKKAFVANLEQGRLLRGASTISQQLIKNVFLNHRRTLSRKFQEAVLTWRLEQVVPKRRILELYLNLVEMGPGVYGVAQASRHYFGRSVRVLTPLQAAHLAALTPSPRHFGQRFERGVDPGLAWTEKLRMLLRMMRRAGSISREEQKRWSAASLSLLKR